MRRGSLLLRSMVAGLAVVAAMGVPCATAAANPWLGGAWHPTWAIPTGMAVTPDGAHVYLTAREGTMALSRDPASGALSPAGLFPGGEGGLAISPDGRSVYAPAGMPGPGGPIPPSPLLAHSRDRRTGALSPAPVEGWPPRFTKIGAVVVSPDGRWVFAVDRWHRELVVMARDSATSGLTVRSTLGAEYAQGGIAVSTDGRRLYTAGYDELGTVSELAIGVDGSLTPVRTLSNVSIGDTLLIAPGEQRLYGGPIGPTTVHRDPSTGELTRSEQWGGFVGEGWGDEHSAMAVAPDGSLFVTHRSGNALLQLVPSGDGLASRASYGLGSPRAVALSPDARHAYVASGIDYATPATVSVFSRDQGTGELTFSSLLVAPRPPVADPAPEVVIDGGQSFTNDTDVTLEVEAGSRPLVQIANANHPAGASLRERSSGNRYRWRIAPRRRDRYVANVVVRGVERFGGTLLTGQSVSRRIVLDRKRPQLIRARVRGLRTARQGRRGRTVLALRARDNRSRVRRVQITRRRSRPGRARPYRRLIAVRTRATRRLYVRVIDGAGNRSRWRRVRAPRAGD